MPLDKTIKNRKHTEKKVLDLLWAIRHCDKFYFDTYGKLWLKEMIKEQKRSIPSNPNH